MAKNTRRNIVWITPGFAADESDSQCIPPLQLLARELAQVPDINLRIISLHYPYRSDPFDWHGLSVYPSYKKGPFSRFRIWAQALRYLRQLHREAPLDLLHSFWLTDAALLGHWFSRNRPLPHWVTLMGQDARSSNRYLRLLPVRRMNAIALSPFHAATWERNVGEAPQLLIPWGMEKPTTNPGSSIKKDIDILGVGNLIPLKDFNLWVDLVITMIKTGKARRAVLIGDGPDRPQLVEKIRPAGLAGQVEVKGALPRKEVLQYMQRSRVLLHPSTYESFGFVLLEALAQRMYVVSRPVGMAASSSQWWLGENRAELAAGLIRALQRLVLPPATYPHPLRRTLALYLKVYDEMLK